jgi:uncharacterized protein (DUF488 family)
VTKKVYTIGYTGRTPEELWTIAETLDADIFDIRFSPRSRVAHWNGGRLIEALAGRYRWVQALGNAGYKIGTTRLLDFDAGREEIERNPRPVILMCACKDYADCHRSAIADKLRALGFDVHEIQAKQVRKESELEQIALL